MKASGVSLRAGLATFAAWLAIMVLPGLLLGRHGDGKIALDEAVSSGVALNIAAAGVFLLAIAFGLGWRRGIGLAAPRPPRSLLILWLPALYIAIFAAAAAMLGLPPMGVTAILLTNAMLVGVSEEVMFRGVMFSALRSRLSFWPSVWIASIMFGAIHALNVLTTSDLVMALLQSGGALCSGLFFLAIRVRTGSLLPGIVTHAIWDFLLLAIAVQARSSGYAVGEAPQGGAMAAPALAIAPLLVYGLILLHGHRKSTAVIAA